eukprot:COSAG06_NODE_1175_length_10410_cov_7.148579_4_plen_199_part_00
MCWLARCPAGQVYSRRSSGDAKHPMAKSALRRSARRGGCNGSCAGRGGQRARRAQPPARASPPVARRRAMLRGWRSCLVASPKQPPHPPRPPCLSARRRRTRRPSWRPSRRSLGGVTHTQRQPGAHTTPASPHRPRPGDSRLRPGLERGLWPCKLTPDHTLILFLPLIILPRRLRIGESIFIRRTFISLADGSIGRTS